MKKYWKWILAAIAILLAGLLIWFFFFYNSAPRLPKMEKEKIETIYYEHWIVDSKFPEKSPLIWYDENGYVEEEGVWRYVGTYGDCYAFLLIGDNEADYLVSPPMHVQLPFPIPGLCGTVYYPSEAHVVLYHTKNEFSYADVYGTNFEGTIRMCQLRSINNREDWLTDEQLEQLTQDIEAISKAHN